jgi:hypothetical protein
MPFTMRKLPKKELYRVYNTKTKRVHAYGTTLEKAKKQIRFLYMNERKMSGPR